MTIQEFLVAATTHLETAGIESARLDCLVLLEDALGRDRSSLLASPSEPLPEKIISKLNTQIVQRIDHTPLAYIRGKASFYGRYFTVGKGVLVPRPESEAIITALVGLRFDPARHDKPIRIADIGTGSGCLGITAALELHGAHIDLYDTDPTALTYAATNTKKHRVHATLYSEDLLTHAIHRHYDVLLANLPYVPLDYPINKAAMHEPSDALFAGNDGLDAYRRLWRQVPGIDQKPRYIITEALESQHAALVALAEVAGYRHQHSDGLVQQFQFI
ncbi:MAG TPA: HemK/PrmC family methyltransferase [Candidatus Saccharimonadales bacterium]|nr:HemK/PrmC family methyltransferase [Candidatus Saccharimonadales bacterium]